jgi:integrase
MRHHEMSVLAPEQVHVLLEAAKGDRLEALYVLALSTGMRQGELLALRWRDLDLDLDNATLQVRGTVQRTMVGLIIAEPKTTRSRRRVALSPTAVETLRTHRIWQVSERLALGSAWEDQDLVFPNTIGKPIEATNLLRSSFFPLLAKAHLPRIRFHDLRHTAATLLLSRGVHPKVVAEMLGHATISITLDTYSHVLPDMQREAARAMETVLGG